MLEQGFWVVIVLPTAFAILLGIIEEVPYKQAWFYAAAGYSFISALYAHSLYPFNGQFAMVSLFSLASLLFLIFAAKSKESP